MPSSKTKINLVSPNLNISDIESKFQNKGTSEISVLDEFLLEIFIDFLN